MTIYENILLCIVYLILPLLVYLFFVAYNKNINRDEDNLILEICLVTSIFLLIKLGQPITFAKLVLIVNIPLLIAYNQKKYFSALIISSLIVVYQYKGINTSIFFLILEYVFYFVMYYLFEKKKYSTKISNNLFIGSNILMFIIYFYHQITIVKIIIEIIVFVFMNILVKSILDKASKVMQYHMNVKEFEQEKQIRNSLFKITHEIKNPLAVCKGYLDMFDVENIEHSKKYVPIIKEEIEKTLILLQDLLNFSKIKIEKEVLDINYVLEETIDTLKPLFKDKNIDLANYIMDEDVYIEGDYNRLCQVLVNIIKNSVEALYGVINPKMIISSNIKNDFVQIIISDNGSGMAKEIIDNIYEPFFTTKKNGTGLGIPMSLEIIKSHGGNLHFYSEDNNGTKVVITLPVIKDFNNNYDL